MKFFKKFMAVFCAVALIISCVPMMLSAENTIDTIPAMSNTGVGVVWSKEGACLSRTYANGAKTMNWASGWGGIFYYNFSKGTSVDGIYPIDVSAAEYLEFDIYASTAVPAMTLAVTSGKGENAGRKHISLKALDAGWNHICLSMATIASGTGYTTTAAPYSAAALNAMYVNATVSPIDTTVESVSFRLANIAFTKTSPNMNNNHVTVWSNEGIFWTRFNPKTDTTLSSYNGWGYYPRLLPVSGAEGGTQIDTTGAEYLEFDVYTDVATTNSIRLWISSANWADSGRSAANDAFPALKKGWNHVCVALSAFDDAKSGTIDWTKVRGFFIENTQQLISESGEATTTNMKFANAALTKSPGMSNIYTPVWKNEGIFWDKVSATGNTTIATNNVNQFPRIDGGNGVDTTKAEFIEFDIYTEVAINNNLAIWMSSNAWTESGRAQTSMPTLKAGWNHVCLDLAKFNKNGGEWEKNGTTVLYDRANIKGFYLYGTPQTDESVALNLCFANVAFTKDYPNIEESLDHLDVVWQKDVCFWSKDNAANTKNLDGALLNGGETVDVSTAKYCEVDIYSSVDLTNGGSFWLSSNTGTNSGRARVTTSTLKAGWNHLCVEMSAFNKSGGEFAQNGVTTLYDITALKSAILEITPKPVDSSVTTVTLKLANLAFTNDSENDVWAKFDNIYSNNLVLQRNKPMYISGTGKNGNVRVDLKNADGQVVRTATTDLAEDDTWELNLEALEGGYNTYDMELYAGNKLQASITGVRIGEVFVASGQSNMDYKMWETYDGAQKYADDSFDKPNITVYNIGDTYWTGDAVPYEPGKNNVIGNWAVGNTKAAHNVSAVAYHFADNMQQKLDVPVGVMTLALPGSSIFSFISREAIEADETLMTYLQANGKYYDESNWEESNAQQKMSSIYNIKVASAAGLQISGMIWYQGCNEVGISDGIYTRALEVLRDCYADTFNYTDGKLPMAITHLHSYGFSDPTLPKMWDQMADAVENNPDDMAQITIYDLPLDWDYSEWAPYGSGGDPIHPITKEPVGDRLGEVMYSLVYDSSYGEKSPAVWNGTKTVDGNSILVDFDFVGDGLATPDGIALDGFSIADSKGIFVNAKAEIVDSDTVRVWSDAVINPVDVSYAYDNYNYVSNLYSTQNGDVFMPAVPFITTSISGKVLAQNNSWLSVDDAELTHMEGVKFAEYDSWSANNATAQLVTDVKDYGDASLKISYAADGGEFYVSPTLANDSGTAFSDITKNYSNYVAITYKVKNVGSAINAKMLAFKSNGLWYYTDINTELSADSGWVNITANLNNLKAASGNTAVDKSVLSSVTNMNFIFDGATAAGDVYLDTIQLSCTTALEIADVTLSRDDLIYANCTVDKALVENYEYDEVYAEFESNGVTTKVTDYVVNEDTVVFSYACTDLSQPINVTLFGNAGEHLCQGETVAYDATAEYQEICDFGGDGSFDDFDNTVVHWLLQGVSFNEVCDFNGDNVSNLRDMVRIKKMFVNNETNSRTDLNADGTTNADDMTFMLDFILMCQFNPIYK